MCLINVPHEHFITQTGKKSKPALINFTEPGAEGPKDRGPRADIWGRGPRAKKNKHPPKYQYFTKSKIVFSNLTICISF